MYMYNMNMYTCSYLSGIGRRAGPSAFPVTHPGRRAASPPRRHPCGLFIYLFIYLFTI